jgi:uncharacterized Tic20 family protein
MASAGTVTEAGLSRDVRKWGMLSHLSALSGMITGVGFLIGPLLVWLLKREDHPFIDEQGKEAVNFQITMHIAMFIGGVLAVLLVGIPILFIVGLVMVVLPIVAAIKADAGESYRYPFTWRVIK